MNKLLLYVLFIVVIISGSTNNLLLKYQNLTVAQQFNFTHPLFQAAIMFIGEMLFIPIYFLFVKKQEKVPPLTTFSFIIPGTLATMATIARNTSLIIINASVYMMIRNSVSLFVALMSVTVLKKKLYRHHITGLGFILVGIGVVGCTVLIEHPENRSASVFGILFALFGQLCFSVLYIVEEKMTTRYAPHPLYMQGMEGINGMALMLVLIPLGSLIKCGFIKYKLLEDVPFALEQMCNSGRLMTLVIAFFFISPLYEMSGLSITRYSSALARVTIDTVRTLVVWIFSLSMKTETFSWIQLIGFLILTTGTFLYNEIIVMPILGLNKYVGISQKKKEEKAEPMIEDSLATKAITNAV